MIPKPKPSFFQTTEGGYMTISNVKRKKKNNNLNGQKKIRLLKHTAIPKPMSSKKVEEEIETLKQQMEFILGVTKTGLDIIDSEFNIRYIDPEWAKVYGDPTDKKCYEYFMNRREVCPRCGIPKALETKRINVTEEVLVKEGDRPIQVTTIPFQNKKGEWLVAEVNVDISERKQIEGALRKAHDDLELRVKERTNELISVVEALQDEMAERERAVKELREGERKYRDLTDSLPEIVYETDEKGRLSLANRCAFETFGYTQGDFDRGLTIFQMVIPDDRKRVEENLQKLIKSGELTSDEYTALRKDGSMFPAFASTNLIVHDNKPVGVRGVVIDITKRKQAEEALRESEERYRMILENIEDAYYEVDLQGNFKFFNDSLCRMLGYSRDELMGMNNQMYTDQENAKKLYQAFNQVYRTGKPSMAFDWEVFRKDGERRIGEVSISLIKDSEGRPCGFRGIARDITEHKRAEEALLESETKYRQLVEHAPIGIYELDLNKLKFLSVNDVMCEVMGYTKKEFLSMSPYTFLSEESRNILAERMKKLFAGEKVPDSVEFKLRTKNGREFWALINIKLFYQDGRPFKAQVVAQDISERKKLEEQLIHSQKMEAVGQLAGGIAHDFNNLLTVIKGYCQLSLLNLEESDPRWGNLQEIEKATQRASDLTRQLLAFSRRQILDLKVLDLNALLKDLNKMLRRIIGEDIELVTLLAGDLGRVKIDPGQIEQVVLNLAVNARDAMPSGGKLTIETDNVELDEEYAETHVGLTPGHYVRLSVSDTGAGMSPQVKEKIFEPFFTTKEKGKGTGLGLSTVYGIVKQSNGNIWVYSEPGCGTTVKIYLPRAEEELDTQYRRDETKLLPKGKETVLLVEDEISVRDLASRFLHQQGYTVLEAANGDEALHMARKQSWKKIHLLLTDMVMPQMSGRALAQELKCLRPDIKVLYTSGYTDDTIVRHGILEHGTPFLQKPFSLKALSHKVREALDG
jgi:PAS domain S-box-containing protein